MPQGHGTEPEAQTDGSRLQNVEDWTPRRVTQQTIRSLILNAVGEET